MKKLTLALMLAGAATMAMAGNGADLYKKCAGCHGAKGEKKALGKSAVIGGGAMDIETLVKDMIEYREGKRDLYGMGKMMKTQMQGYSDEDIRVLAEYIHGLK